jgi:hypothetical protein
MQNLLLAATIPFDGYTRPILFSDGALIGLIALPANAVADIEKSGLVAGHLCTPFIQTAPTSSRQPAKLFASAGEDSRCLR